MSRHQAQLEILAALAIFWMEKHNSLVPPGGIGVIVPSSEELIADVIEQTEPPAESD